MSQQERIRSRWWYLLPILFDIIGGVIAYFILKDDDPKKAKNCLWLGIVLIAVEIGLFAIFVSICTSIGPCAEFHDEFMRGIEELKESKDMMQHPQQMQQMMQDPQFRNQMMNQMIENPELMRQWMSTPEHAQQMAEIMNSDHDFMMEMLSQMMNDEQLRLQMLGHMTESPEMMEQMQQMMGEGRMDQGMMKP